MDRDDKSPWFPITTEEVIRKYGIAEDVGRGYLYASQLIVFIDYAVKAIGFAVNTQPKSEETDNDINNV